MKVIPQTTIQHVEKAIEEFIAPNSTMVTDEHKAYNKVGLKYNHKRVNHRDQEYVRTEDIKVHTNNIEGCWNSLKKANRWHSPLSKCKAFTTLLR